MRRQLNQRSNRGLFGADSLHCQHAALTVFAIRYVERLFDLRTAMTCDRCGEAFTAADLQRSSLFRRQFLDLNQMLRLFLRNAVDATLTTAAMVTGDLRATELLPECELVRHGDEPSSLQLDLVAFHGGVLHVGEVKTDAKFMETKKDRTRLTRRLRDLQDQLIPVELEVSHSWTRPFPDTVRSSLTTRYDSELLSGLPRPWHSMADSKL